jgi:hypothetical protein
MTILVRGRKMNLVTKQVNPKLRRNLKKPSPRRALVAAVDVCIEGSRKEKKRDQAKGFCPVGRG